MAFGWQIVLGSTIGFFGAVFGSMGGVGGGGIDVPMLTLIIGFSPKSSTAISKCTSSKAFLKGVETSKKETLAKKEDVLDICAGYICVQLKRIVDQEAQIVWVLLGKLIIIRGRHLLVPLNLLLVIIAVSSASALDVSYVMGRPIGHVYCEVSVMLTN